jgi:hypothetical protein
MVIVKSWLFDGRVFMIRYDYDQAGLDIQEKSNADDMEFILKIKREQPYLAAFHQVRDHFNANNIHTDVMFYVHANHEFNVIVRKDYYVDFILALFKYRLLNQVSWS